MYTDFDTLPDHARIWIYQADRKLNDSEITEIQELTRKFIENWDSHGATVEGSFAVEHHRFLILAANQELNAPGGCSIDKSVGLVRSLGQKYDIDFFNRTHVIFWENETLQTTNLNELKTKISEGKLHPKSLVFDNLIQTKKDLKHWKKVAEQTWLKRYF